LGREEPKRAKNAFLGVLWPFAFASKKGFKNLLLMGAKTCGQSR
jgi:hypothetical protein